KIYPEIQKRITAGISETELAVQAASALANGSPPRGVPMTQSGPNGATPHRPTGDRRLIDGDSVVVDYFLRHGGYHRDMTRTFVVGKPSEQLKKAYRAVRSAQRIGMDMCRAGIACEDVDAAARHVIDEAGFGPFFVHRLGHGVGLDGHEPPYLV